MTKKIIPIIIALVIVGGGTFYGGMRYGQSKNPLSNFSRQNFQNLTPEQRQQFSQQGIGRREAGAGFLAGEIIGKDEQSLTLKMPDSGSKIIFFSDSTNVVKSVDGSKNDLTIGEQVIISGEENSDGSYTAKMIQLRNKIIMPDSGG